MESLWGRVQEDTGIHGKKTARFHAITAAESNYNHLLLFIFHCKLELKVLIFNLFTTQVGWYKVMCDLIHGTFKKN